MFNRVNGNSEAVGVLIIFNTVGLPVTQKGKSEFLHNIYQDKNSYIV